MNFLFISVYQACTRRLSGVYQAFIRRLSGVYQAFIGFNCLTSFLEKVIISHNFPNMYNSHHQKKRNVIYHNFNFLCFSGLLWMWLTIAIVHPSNSYDLNIPIPMFHIHVAYIYMWVTSPIFIIVYPSKNQRKYGVTSNTPNISHMSIYKCLNTLKPT